MSETAVSIPPPSRTLLHNMKLFLPAIVLFFALVGYNFWNAYQASKPELSASGFPLSPEIEERYGVRFTGVYLSAKNGLVDLRYRVVDIGKANNFGHYTETSPLLIAQDSGKKIEVTIMMLHNHRVETGRQYYILFRNTDNALKVGEKVTLQIGDIQVRDIIVQ